MNALMLLLTREIATALDLAIRVDGFATALWGALVISLVGMALNAALDND